jgi:hypothetical protein
MRKLPWAAFGLLASALATNLVFAGCGSEDANVDDNTEAGDENSMKGDTGANGDTGAQDSGSKDAFIDAILDGGRNPDGSVACKPIMTACMKSTDCCTANCDPVSGKCGPQTTVCGLPNDACVTGNQCCTGSCVSGKCSNLQCVADNASCGVDSDCCSGTCTPDGMGGGACQPLGSKPVSGNPCTMNSQCASGWCNNGICANPSFCVQTGDICSTAAQCCTGDCNIAAGKSVGVCATLPNAGGVTGGPCKPAGTLCSPDGTCTGASCCSRSCAPSPTSGLGVCQPESGCHLIGDLCTADSECCGLKGLPGDIKQTGGMPSTDVKCMIAAGQTYGVCDFSGAVVCRPAGDLCKPGLGTIGGAMGCSTSAECCAGNDNSTASCQIDSNGIPRCLVTPGLPDGGCTPVAAGTSCASSADCCGQPCLATGNPAKPYACGATCEMQGTTCTANGDCCNGLPCALPAGSATGVCGGTLLPDGGVSTDPPPGSDGGVIQPPDSGAGSNCALYGQTCMGNADCCSGVPCTNGTCHYP